jgi:hypothetical protein
MLPIYMTLWSIVMIMVLGITRIRNMAQLITVTLITALVLLMSQVLFVEFSAAAGADPSHVFSNPGNFLDHGIEGWLALLILPCGWLGPIIGLHLAQRWQLKEQEVY